MPPGPVVISLLPTPFQMSSERLARALRPPPGCRRTLWLRWPSTVCAVGATSCSWQSRPPRCYHRDQARRRPRFRKRLLLRASARGAHVHCELRDQSRAYARDLRQRQRAENRSCQFGRVASGGVHLACGQKFSSALRKLGGALGCFAGQRFLHQRVQNKTTSSPTRRHLGLQDLW